MDNYNKKNNPYKDIIHLARPISKTHGLMPIRDRAAQFSPFAAVSGHDLAIKETSRLTEKRIELDENAKNLLDEKLRSLTTQSTEPNEIEIVFFQPDATKLGGHYLTVVDQIKKIDVYENTIVLLHGQTIPLEDILDIKSPLIHIY